MKKKEMIMNRDNLIKVALLVDEYFGALNTAFGGYGFLARNVIAKHLPDENISVDVLLRRGDSKYFAKEHIVDGVKVIEVPKKSFFARKWLKRQEYNLFLSIELTTASYNIIRLVEQPKLLLWIQDPRPWYEWREIFTVKLFPETCYWDSRAYEYVHHLAEEGRVRFISQAEFLNSKARDLYRLKNEHPIEIVRNPIDVNDVDESCLENKRDVIIFLGRIESVKRGWLFCEIAKKLPQYEFRVLGQTFREKEKNNSILRKYSNVKNLKFEGHVSGELKIQHLREAKILINTSIHEALPVSFIEALLYGVLLVSNRNPDQLTERFGLWVGDVLGDGFDAVDKYVEAVKNIMNNEDRRRELSKEAHLYIKKYHDQNKVIPALKAQILDLCDQAE